MFIIHIAKNFHTYWIICSETLWIFNYRPSFVYFHLHLMFSFIFIILIWLTGVSTSFNQNLKFLRLLMKRDFFPLNKPWRNFAPFRKYGGLLFLNLNYMDICVSNSFLYLFKGSLSAYTDRLVTHNLHGDTSGWFPIPTTQVVIWFRVKNWTD